MVIMATPSAPTFITVCPFLLSILMNLITGSNHNRMQLQCFRDSNLKEEKKCRKRTLHSDLLPLQFRNNASNIHFIFL